MGVLTWDALASLMPTTAASASAVAPPQLTLCRERNGWCMTSAQIWLALEVKGARYATVREMASSAPEVRWPDGRVQRDSVDVLRDLDAAFPDSPTLWPPSGVDTTDVDAMVAAFALTMPAGARKSSRLAHMFCADEGFVYDPLPHDAFLTTLDGTEALLGEHEVGVVNQRSAPMSAARAHLRAKRAVQEMPDVVAVPATIRTTVHPIVSGPILLWRGALCSRYRLLPNPRALCGPLAVTPQ